jgi:hypothetical protein
MSWWALDSILKTQAELVSYYRMQEPVACPLCGEPLRQGPPQMWAIKYCPWGHFEYPRDWDMDTMAGM